MTVAEFVEWLKTQDQTAKVYVVTHFTGTILFDPDKHVEHSNYSGGELLLGVYEG